MQIYRSLLSILKKFSENGANIIACARKKSSQFENDITNISNEYKNKITPVFFDLLNKDEIEKGIKEIFNLSDNIEILVNNAGINQAALFQMTPIKKIKEIFEINFFSHLLLTQKLIKIMPKTDVEISTKIKHNFHEKVMGLRCQNA